MPNCIVDLRDVWLDYSCFCNYYSFDHLMIPCCFTKSKQNDCNAEFFARINTIASRYHLRSFFVDTSYEKIRTLRFGKHIFHSQLIRDSEENIANGLTVFNPLLVGAISSSLIPSIYGPFDGFSLLLIILGTIFRQVSINWWISAYKFTFYYKIFAVARNISILIILTNIR